MVGWKRQLCHHNLFYFSLHCSWAFCKPLLKLKLSNCLGWYCVSMQNCVQKIFLDPFIHMLATVWSCVIVYNVWLDRLKNCMFEWIISYFYLQWCLLHAKLVLWQFAHLLWLVNIVAHPIGVTKIKCTVHVKSFCTYIANRSCSILWQVLVLSM